LYLTPLTEGVPLGIGIGTGSEETRMMGLPDGRKCFELSLAILISYRCVMDTQPSTQPHRRSNYALCISASCSKNWGMLALPWNGDVAGHLETRPSAYVTVPKLIAVDQTYGHTYEICRKNRSLASHLSKSLKIIVLIMC